MLNQHSAPALFLLLCLIITFLGIPEAHSQDSSFHYRSSDSTNYVVRQINFHGNDHVKSNTLRSLIQTHTNRNFLGIPGFTLFYYIWKLTNHSFGEKPALLTYSTVTSDKQRITRYYNSIGYLNASTDTSFTYYDSHKVKVNFYISEGKRSFIKSIAYSGIPDSAFVGHQAKNEFYISSPLTNKQINDSTFKANIPFITKKLNDERSRIIDYLNNNGYAAATLDSVIAYVQRDKKNPYSYHLLYQVHAGKRYRFGNLYIQLAGPGEVNDSLLTYQKIDTLQGKPYALDGQKIIIKKQYSAHSKSGLLTDQILFKPGTVFSKKRYNKTLNAFQNLGMLNVLSFGGYQNQTQQDSTNTDNTIPLYFKLQTLPRNNIGFDVFGLRRYGFGSGAGITYSNNNLFGRGENLSISMNGSFEYVSKHRVKTLRKVPGLQIKNAFYRSFQTKVDLMLPRLVFPFGGLNKSLFFANSSTRFSLSYKSADRPLFTINSDLKFNLQYQVKHTNSLTSIFDLLQLEILDTHPSDIFTKSLENKFEDSPLILEQIEENFRPQFTSLTRYTFRDINTDLIKRNFGHFSEYSVGVGGVVPYLLDRFAVTPGTIEGELPSPVRFSKNRLAYSLYVKLTADYRRYFHLSNSTVFAVRGFAGYAKTYGKRKIIPLNQRFYAGGSNDVRGWSLFSLGPGAISPQKKVIPGGQIKLLSQIELRETFLRNFLSSDWIVALFTDAGNIWYGSNEQLPSINLQNPTNQQPPSSIDLDKGRFKFSQFYKQIAVGAGAGIRIDFKYLILRFDFAFRLHDLQKGWFGRPSRKLHFVFGIGQSF